MMAHNWILFFDSFSQYMTFHCRFILKKHLFTYVLAVLGLSCDTWVLHCNPTRCSVWDSLYLWYMGSVATWHVVY